ncbi:hypothetical protein [Pseudoalteromonas rubra]|nr:hypothetical protein [Pseudoalteromonas rubra]
MAITYRPNDATLAEIERLKTELGIATTSKLLTHLVHAHSDKLVQISTQRAQITEARDELRRNRQIVTDFQQAFSGLMAVGHD